MSQCGCCMSPQEDRVVNKSVDRNGRERVYGILEQNQFTLPHVDVERAKYFTESMRETEGELLTLRWAKALKNIAEKMTVYITPNQLIAGRVDIFFRQLIQLFPGKNDVVSIDKEIFFLAWFSLSIADGRC